MDDSEFDMSFKVLLLGDSGVGKTNLLYQYSTDTFCSNFFPTIGLDYRFKILTINGKKVRLQIWDTAGQERFHTLSTSYYRGAAGVVLVFDICDENSFANIGKWLNNIDNYGSGHEIKILVGNKIDLGADRVVPLDKAKIMAKSYGIQYFEVSAMLKTNIDVAFKRLAEQLFEKRLDFPPPLLGTLTLKQKMKHAHTKRSMKDIAQSKCC